jgi:ribosomal protein S4
LLKYGLTVFALRRERRIQDRFYKALLAQTSAAELRREIVDDWEVNDRESAEELRHFLSERLRSTVHRLGTSESSFISAITDSWTNRIA